MVYVALLGVIYYAFCVAAHALFKGLLTDPVVNFNTFGLSMLTMFQVRIEAVRIL